MVFKGVFNGFGPVLVLKVAIWACFGWLDASQDFVYITDNTYSKDELLQMECTMLGALEFQVPRRFKGPKTP